MLSNFLIVGTQRTGSTVVAEALNFHPEVACGREWTVRTAWHSKIRVAHRALAGDFSVLDSPERERAEKLLARQTRWLGFKLLFRASDKWLFHPRLSAELWLDRLESFRLWLSQRPKIHIIHIVRSNALEWIKSRYLARVTGFYSGKEYPSEMKIKVPVRSAVKRLYAKNWIDGRLATLASSNPYLQISYEDFEKNEENVLLRILDFLKCDCEKLLSVNHGLKKQSTKDASHYLSNYGELSKEISKRKLVNM